MKLPQYTSTIAGLSESISALERFAPDLKRSLDREIKGVLLKVVSDARDYLPFDVTPSGWKRANVGGSLIGPLAEGEKRGPMFPVYDGAKAKLGIKSLAPTSKKMQSGFRNSYGVVQRDAAGAIFETAGRGSKASRARTRASRSTNPNASQQFIGVIENRYGQLPTAQHAGNDKGRALIKSVDNNKKTAQAGIFRAIESAERKAQARMDQILNRREV